MACAGPDWTHPDKSLQYDVGIERLSGLARNLHHHVEVLVPEHAVGRVDLGDVAEQPLRVDLRQDRVVLQVAQAVEEELRKRRRFPVSFIRRIPNSNALIRAK